MKYWIVMIAVAVAGCSTTRDPHAPKTIVAGDSGGAVTVSHGQRLFIRLPSDPGSGHEWRRVEPMVVTVVPVGAPLPQGIWLTPVRSGTEKLRFEYRPATGEGAVQKTVSYDVTVPETQQGLRALFR